jgi:hypothetical protein
MLVLISVDRNLQNRTLNGKLRIVPLGVSTAGADQFIAR